MSRAVASLFIHNSRTITRQNFNNSDAYLYRRVADITAEVAKLGQYVNTDQVFQAPQGSYYTGEVSDCTAFVIRRGSHVLLSHVQGLGDSGALGAGIREFRSRTDRLSHASELYLWTMPTTLQMPNYENSSIKVITDALLASYGEHALAVLPTVTTIVTGHRGVEWNGKGVAYANAGGVGGMYERTPDAPRDDPYQGLKLAEQFIQM